MKMPWILKPGNLLLVGGSQIKETLINTILEIMEQFVCLFCLFSMITDKMGECFPLSISD